MERRKKTILHTGDTESLRIVAQYRNGQKRKVKNVMCRVSRVMCHVSRVTCHLSLTPTATATDPFPANSPIMHSRLVRKKTQKFQKQKNIKTAKAQKSRGMPILAIHSLTRNLQSTGKRGFHDGTHTHTTDGHCDLETESAYRAN